ncbi:translation initiation factor IF-2-like [Motacilla alba alba]|uniref:translation initiation factor IF-2-like n=1 Tax=Motacilla alba alba TaxID=1094192 RepID=UPI0018D56FB9|nr:translation initiation factor IF-2-like [Motacilla alba alba]
MGPPDVTGKHRDVTARPPPSPWELGRGLGPRPLPAPRPPPQRPLAARESHGGAAPAGPAPGTGSGNREPGARSAESGGAPRTARCGIGLNTGGLRVIPGSGETRGAGGIQRRNEGDAGHPSAHSSAAALGQSSPTRAVRQRQARFQHCRVHLLAVTPVITEIIDPQDRYHIHVFPTDSPSGLGCPSWCCVHTGRSKLGKGRVWLSRHRDPF